MRILLKQGDLDIHTTEDDKYEFVTNSAKGELKFDQIRNWIGKRIAATNS